MDQIQCLEFILKNAHVDLAELQVKDVFQLNHDVRTSFIQSLEAGMSPEGKIIDSDSDSPLKF